MPALCSFNTQSINSPSEPNNDTQAILNYPRPLIACPRLARGIRQLDVDKHRPILVSFTTPFFTKDWANCRFIAREGSTLRSGTGDVFALAPGDLDFLTGEHLRYPWKNPNDPASVRIDFERPFVTPPKVVVFFNLLELGNKDHWRVLTTASNIDVNGFTLNIETWSGSILNAARVCWIAYPEDRDHIFSTSVSTMDIRPWNEPQLKHSREISFDSVEFLKKPSVFVALNFIDIDCNASLRISAYVDGISTTRLVWHIDTWLDTVLYAAGATIIAFN